MKTPSKNTVYSIEFAVEPIRDSLFNIRSMIIDNNVSNYPIFIFSKKTQNKLGRLILPSQEVHDSWTIYISHLEDLYNNKIILKDKIDSFKLNYKNLNDKLCILFIGDEDEMGFIFVSYL